MQKTTLKNITQTLNDEEFMEDVKTVTLIHNHKNPLQFAIYFDDLTLMNGFESEVNINLTDCDTTDWETLYKTLTQLKNILVFSFKDIELTEAWKKSYTQGCISKKQWDRRTKFNPYNKINEMFTIDPVTYQQITGEIKEKPLWKEYIVEWYNNHLIQ